MTHRNLYWPQHEISFRVGDEDNCGGLLRIIPLGCELQEQQEDPDAPGCSSYGIYVQVKIETIGVECSGGDFISPKQFRALLEMLKGGQKLSSNQVAIRGDDGGVDIHFQWREEGDVSVIGDIPATGGYSNAYFTANPLELRKTIKTSVRFEFLMEARDLREPCDELENLLEYVRSIEEKESRFRTWE